MNLLILRCGDTSLSYRLMLQARGLPSVSGEIRRIGREAEHVYSYPRGRGEGGTDAVSFAAAAACMATLLGEVEVAPGENEPVETVAYLLPTGGTTPVPVTRVDDGLVAMISAGGGAPGNRGAIDTLVACREIYPDAQHVVVWDDAFYCDLPPESRGYLLPESLDLPFDLRRRGFRGLLHSAALTRVGRVLVPAEAAKRANPRNSRPPSTGARIVLCFFERHAGVTAVVGNAPVWTTFGTGPGDGLPGERGVGAIPVGALEAVLTHTRLPAERLLAVLRNGGGLGVRESDELDRLALEAFRGIEPSRTVFATFVREIVGAVGAAATILGGMDALVFVGERALASHRFRTAVCAGLGAWGVDLPSEGPISPFEITPLHDDTKTPVFAASINEDELVAREVARFLGDPTVGPSVPPPAGG